MGPLGDPRELLQTFSKNVTNLRYFFEMLFRFLGRAMNRDLNQRVGLEKLV